MQAFSRMFIAGVGFSFKFSGAAMFIVAILLEKIK
jgi:hypothetical protein